jgi:glycosyltransferase involved in cell wall biosynthesis
MKLHVYTVCFNEERMLPYFLEHYARWASKIVVYDNMSTDRSAEIIRSWPNTEIIPFDTDGQLQELRLTEIRSNCWKGDDADYVIVCDVDEFLHVDDLPEFLAAQPEIDVFEALGFNMIARRFPSDYSRSLLDQVRRGSFAGNYCKMMLFKPRSVHAMNYGPGSHTASPEGSAPLRVLRATDHAGRLRLLHYKYLSLDYLVDRHTTLAGRLGTEYSTHGYAFHYLDSRLRSLRKYLKMYLLSQDCVNRWTLSMSTRLALYWRQRRARRRQASTDGAA